MTQVRGLIARAHRLIGLAQPGDSLPEAAYHAGLIALNALLDTWRTEHLTVFAYQRESLPLTSGKAAYTIGPTGDLLTIRPVKLLAASVLSNGRETPVSIFTADQWAALPSKTLTDELPSCLYYEGTVPLGTLQVFPVPTAVSELLLTTYVPLEQVTLTSIFDLPPGYDRALTYNLALDLSAEFGKKPPSVVQSVAATSLAALQRANQRPVLAAKELAGLVGSC